MGFYLLSIAVVITLLVFAFRFEFKDLKKAFLIVLICWLTYLVALSQTDWLNSTDLPPRVPLLLIVPGIALVILWSRTEPFKKAFAMIPIWIPVLLQGFRVIVELLIHDAYVNGLLPKIVTYEGLNFDIITGVSAIIIAILWRLSVIGLKAALVWNIAGLAILSGTLASFMGAFYFRDSLNIPEFPLVVGNLPYILLPGLMVPFAVLLHVVSIIQIRLEMKKAAH